MRFLMIDNPAAGHGRAPDFPGRLAQRLREAGHDLVLLTGSSAADAWSRAEEAGVGEVDRLVLLGGDGTLRGAANRPRGIPPWPVAVVPVGTANLAARETGFPLGADPDIVAECLLAAEPWPVDLMEVRWADGRTERAVTCVGAGLDGAVVEEVQRLRSTSGSHGYAQWIRPMLATLARFRWPTLEVVVDGGVVRQGTLVVVQNARSYGGLFSISPGAAMDSGRLDVAVLKPRGHRDLVRLLLRAAADDLADDRLVRVVPGARVEIRCRERVPVQADGDAAGATDLEVRLLPRAMTLLRVPAGRRAPAPLAAAAAGA
jgi:diacylglycerol kinase (ATP)